MIFATFFVVMLSVWEKLVIREIKEVAKIENCAERHKNGCDYYVGRLWAVH